MWLKICGITRERDARLAAALGADAIGFVFWPKSRRHVAPERARDIVLSLLPGVTAVGVFVNEPPEQVELTARRVGLHVVQLHGDESPGDCERMTMPVIKAFGAGPGFETSVLEGYAGVTVLVDAEAPAARGGTGTTANWAVAQRIARTRPTILSGGLTPDNVAAAIASVRPFGVDVSSGVEASPGIKDAERIRRFVAAVRQAERRPG